MSVIEPYEIEMIADQALRAYRSLPCFRGKTVFNTDPTILAEKLLHLSVYFDNLSDDLSLLGMTSFSDIEVHLIVNKLEKIIPLDGKTLYIEEALKKPSASRGRLNFTIGHEIAHHLLKKAFPYVYGCKNTMAARCVFARRCYETDSEEVLADQLTAELLMPKDAIDYCLYTYGFRGHIRVAFGREMLDKEKQLVFCMMNYLGVSKTALLRRLTVLGYTTDIQSDDYWEEDMMDDFTRMKRRLELSDRNRKIDRINRIVSKRNIK